MTFVKLREPRSGRGCPTRPALPRLHNRSAATEPSKRSRPPALGGPGQARNHQNGFTAPTVAVCAKSLLTSQAAARNSDTSGVASVAHDLEAAGQDVPSGCKL